VFLVCLFSYEILFVNKCFNHTRMNKSKGLKKSLDERRWGWERERRRRKRKIGKLKWKHSSKANRMKLRATPDNRSAAVIPTRANVKPLLDFHYGERMCLMQHKALSLSLSVMAAQAAISDGGTGQGRTGSS